MENLLERIAFKTGVWKNSINVHDFILQNIKPYKGDGSFLVGPSEKTTKLWDVCKEFLLKERENDGCLAIDTEVISNITSFEPGYIQKEYETIVGLQTDELLKRAMKPFGGIKLVESAVAERGLKVSDRVIDIFNYAKNHNQAVFDAYDSEIKTYRSKHVLTGLPDNYARGRIIGDFRRVALYGIDRLIAEKKADIANVSGEMNSAANIQSQSMTELNATVDQLSVSVNEIAQNATQLAGVVADTKEDSDKVEDKMRTTVEVSEKGKADMESVGNALHNIEISIHNLEEAVDKVGTASGEIVDIIKLIGDIAEETNLLSLNASIEAARAGEAGRGFAVVASQIGVLAKNSADSVAHITSLINEINGLVDDAVKQAGSSASDIESSADLIHIAVDTFDQIFQNIQETSHLIEGVVEKINQVDQVATNVAAISEEQAASSDEILATSESMLQQAKSISKNSEQVEAEAGNLAESADQLADQVKQFQI